MFDETRVTDGLKWQLSILKKFDFTLKRQNIFFVDDCSTGKTSLASTLGMNALEKGAKVIYITLDNFTVSLPYNKLVMGQALKDAQNDAQNDAQKTMEKKIIELIKK